MRHRTQKTGPWFAENTPMTTEQLLAVAPSVAAEHAHSRVSKRYGFVPTIQIVNSLATAGFQCVGAKQSKARSEDRHGYQKHVLQFTKDNFRSINLGNDKGDIRVVITNSHDAGGSYQGNLGVYRHRCLNSLIANLSFGRFRVRHHAGAMDEVLEATYHILDDIPQLEERISKYQRTFIPFGMQVELAQRAVGLRWGKDAAPFGAYELLTARREEDKKNDLWTVFNRVQENVVRGGVAYNGTLKGKDVTRHTRAITSAVADLAFNRGLWQLADEYATV